MPSHNSCTNGVQVDEYLWVENLVLDILFRVISGSWCFTVSATMKSLLASFRSSVFSSWSLLMFSCPFLKAWVFDLSSFWILPNSKLNEFLSCVPPVSWYFIPNPMISLRVGSLSLSFCSGSSSGVWHRYDRWYCVYPIILGMLLFFAFMPVVPPISCYFSSMWNLHRELHFQIQGQQI